MKGFTTLVALIIGSVTGAGIAYYATNYTLNNVNVGGFSDPFISLQLATDPDNGECLTTDGTNNSWSSDCGSGGGGGSGVGWAVNTGTTTLYSSLNIPVIITDNDQTATGSDSVLDVWGDVTADFFTASSSNATSSFLWASSTQQSITNLWGVVAIDATTESTIETAIDTLANLTSWGGFSWNPADAGTNAFFGWDDTAGQYENLTASEALSIIGGAANDFDGSGDVTITEADISDLQSYLVNVIEDTTPQLGGNFDVNGNKITSVSSGNIDIEPNGTGNVLLGNFTFDADQTVGAGQDNYVLTFDNGDGEISLEAAGAGSSEWTDSGAFIYPTETTDVVVIGGSATTTQGEGNVGDILDVQGSSIIEDTLYLGGYERDDISGLVTLLGMFSASSTGRAGIEMVNEGTGTAPEFRFTVADGAAASNYMSFGLTNAAATTPGTLWVDKGNLGYLFANARNLGIGTTVAGDHFYLATGGTAAGNIAAIVDGTNQNFGIGTSTPVTARLAVQGESSGTIVELISDTGTKFIEMLNTGVITLLGEWDFGDATSVEIPNSTSPTVNATGEIAFDTTSGQLKVYDGTTANIFMDEWSWGATFASSSLAFDGAYGAAGTTTVEKAGFKYAHTITEYYCETDQGTVGLRIGDGTNWSTHLECDTTGETASSPSNNTFTSRETIQIEVGGQASNPNRILLDVTTRWTAD